jgi:hypothetical protein
LLAKTKWRLYNGIAHFHSAPHLEGDKAVSERSKRLEIAQALVIKAHGYSLQVGKELEEMVKSHSKGIINALEITESANYVKYQQTDIDQKILGPVERPSEVVVNPIPLFNSIKCPEDFPNMFHPLVSPKNRNDVLRLLEGYEIFVKDGTTGLRVIIQELDKTYDRYGGLVSTINERHFACLEEKNRRMGEQILSDLSRLQLQEKIITSDCLLNGLEYALGKLKSRDQSKIKGLGAELNRLKAEYETKCGDFSPLDWNKVMPTIFKCLSN